MCQVSYKKGLTSSIGIFISIYVSLYVTLLLTQNIGKENKERYIKSEKLRWR